MSDNDKQSQPDLSERLASAIEKLSLIMEKSRVEAYFSLAQQPWRLFLTEFIASLFRGVGLALGATLVVAVVIYLVTQVLSHFVTVPLIGHYLAQILAVVKQYSKPGMLVR